MKAFISGHSFLTFFTHLFSLHLFSLPFGSSVLFLLFFFFCNISLPTFAEDGKSLELTPKWVAELTLQQSLKVKQIDLKTQKTFISLYQAKALFDLEFKSKFGYNYDKAETFAGNSNLLDESMTLNFGLLKKFSSGTILNLDYSENSIESQLNPFNSVSSSRFPAQSLKSTSLSIRQNLWQNYFGFSDQKIIESVNEQIQQSQFDRVQNLDQVILDNLTLFWNTYTAKEQLRLNTLAQEKYDYLVRTVQRKETLGIVNPGELSRLKAEQLAVHQRIYTASQSYLQNLNLLKLALQINSPSSNVSIRVSENLPPLPPFSVEEWTDEKLEALLPIRSARSKLKSLQIKKEAVDSSTKPSLDLVLKAMSTGVDSTKDGAITEMVSGTHPTYFVGLEFAMKIDSNSTRYQKEDLLQDISIAEIELQNSQENTRNFLIDSYRQAKTYFLAAQSAKEIVENRAKVVRQIEEAFKQGRQPLVEVIRAYNESFSSEIDLAKAIGSYNIGLNNYDHFKSELIRLVESSKN